MSQSIKDFELTKIAGEIMTKQYYIVQLDSSGNIEYADTAVGTNTIVGILQNKPLAGEAALYRFGGTSKVVASAAISIGDMVTTTSEGKGVTTITAGDITVGRALEAATADGDIIEVQMNIQNHYQ